MTLHTRLCLSALFLFSACGGAPAETEDAPEAAAVASVSGLWPGYIPYRDDCTSGTFDPFARCPWAVAEGVKRWNAKVPFLPLVPRTTEADFVSFVPSTSAGEGSSYLGKRGGMQQITVADTGLDSTTLIAFLHEVGHAAGLAHEQARFDRDWFVDLNRPNISDWSQFSQGTTARDYGWYDFRSIMHYRSSDISLFALHSWDYVMRTRAGATSWPSMGDLTNGDVQTLRDLYFPDWSGSSYDVKIALAARDPAYGNSARANAFGPSATAYPWACLPGEVCLTADVDGNGATDVVVFNHGRGGYNTVYTMLSDGGGFAVPQTAHSYFCTAPEVCAVGDVDGDGRSDIITFQHGATGTAVYVALSDSSRPGMYRASTVAASNFCDASSDCFVADVDGSGSADLVAVNRINHQVWVVLTHGAGGGFSLDPPFEAPSYMNTLTMPTDASLGQLRFADMDGDRRADAVWFARGSNGSVYVSLSKPGVYAGRFGYTYPSFARWTYVNPWFCVGSEECRLGDVDGDGKIDLLTFDRAGGATYVGLNSSIVGAPSVGYGLLWSTTACHTGGTCEVGDVNADGAVDVVEFMR
ncbi:MAG: FG-GAP-like repeat-containing protein [Myxococcota bacterium]